MAIYNVIDKKRLNQKKFEVIYEYIEPKTIEEKITQEKMLEQIYFPIFDEIQKEINIKNSFKPRART